jgi:pimeloyl-ACP methyl ester carboxylesterase
MSEWAFRAEEGAILAALANGRRAAALRHYFGAEAYPQLRQLALRAAQARPRAGPPVLVLPGIMGSKLGGGFPPLRKPRVLWIDPDSIADGLLTELALSADQALQPMGVLLYAYARLQLELQGRGFSSSLYPYDWRLGLDELGAGLAAYIRTRGEPVAMIGHSMGGMVARVAVRQLPKRLVRKLILLGTPNFGSYAPVQALRGTYPFVRKVALIDARHTPEFLAARVFRTFPGLYHLLPPRQRLRGTNLYTRAGWPAHGPGPNLPLLAQVAAVRAQLAPADTRMAQIIGVNRPTIVAVRRSAGGFEYEFAPSGDGTVPVASARLPGLKTYYTDELHANLANNPAVVQTLLDLLCTGRSNALPQRWRAPRAARVCIDDAALAACDGPKIDWQHLDADERAATMAELSR